MLPTVATARRGWSCCCRRRSGRWRTAEGRRLDGRKIAVTCSWWQWRELAGYQGSSGEKEEFSKEWRGWSRGKMREGGESALLHRLARAAAVWSKVWGVCPWFGREMLRCTVTRHDMQRRWYRSGVDSQVCMGRYIQKRLNSGQGEGRLKAAGGRTEIHVDRQAARYGIGQSHYCLYPRRLSRGWLALFSLGKKMRMTKSGKSAEQDSPIALYFGFYSPAPLLADDILLASHRAPLIAAQRQIDRSRTTVSQWGAATQTQAPAQRPRQYSKTRT